jgi:hypothetical protein
VHLPKVIKTFPLFDIVEKERETQAACVLAVRMGNHLDNRNIGRLRLIE